MGTTYKVILVDYDQDLIEEGIYSSLNSVNQEMSTYIDTSSISRLNSSNIGDWIEVSENFIKVATFSQQLCIETQGAFNISIGHFVNFYGFGPPQVANDHQINKLEELKDQVSCISYKVDETKKRIKRINDVYIDMSAVAKGFAIDHLSSFLDSLSINSYFIELGGEIRYKGNKQKKIPLLAAIENPDETNSPIMTLSSKEYKNLSLATSGEYRNFIERNDNTFSHTIDPQTFKPINREHISVSVIAENAMKADALATALNVMGLEEGLDFSNKNKIKVLYVVKENEEFILKTSKWF